MDPVTASAARPQTTTPARSGVASDYNTFLRMLTTQLRYQDPLDPVDSSDYAAQLATFSGVEQQVETNALLGKLNERFDLLGMAQLSGWVGQEALTTAPVHFSGMPITLRPEPDARADSAVLVVKDTAGNVVSRETVPTDGRPYLWLGGNAAGDPLPQGIYALTLESQRSGEVIATTPVPSYARISEARRSDAGVILRLDGGIDVAASDIRALRMP